jgi:hypothetical protein
MTLMQQIGDLMMDWEKEHYNELTYKNVHNFRHLVGRVKGRIDYFEKHGKLFIVGDKDVLPKEN